MDTGDRKVKHAVIITKSTNFESRAEIVGEYLKSHGVRVTYIYSDFSHREKKRLDRNEPDHIYIHTFPYRKNLSWQRIWSQIDFAKKAEKKLNELDFDFLYVLIPGNSLVPMALRAVKEKIRAKDGRNPELVFDIIDLWPESLRLGKFEKLWPFTYWKGLRDKNLHKAYLIITECDFYRERLHLDSQKSVTMYWGKKEDHGQVQDLTANIDEDNITKAPDLTPGEAVLQIAYLGAINNIIDIDGVVRLLLELNQTLKSVVIEASAEPGILASSGVMLHVIGDGENRETFLSALKQAGIKYQYHGAIFAEAKKDRILSRCSYGLNMMKPGITVGMTMKSIDYWSHGLPIINNIPGDSERLCREERLGINLSMGPEAVKDVLALKLTDASSRNHIQSVYKNLFTEQAMHKVLEKHLPL